MARSPLLDLAFGYMPARIVYAAAELELADAMAGGPRTSKELAKRTGTHEPSLRRLLRALAALGVVRQLEPDRFELTEEGARLRRDAPDSIRGWFRLSCGPEVWRSWGELPATLRTGETAWDRVIGMTMFEFVARNPELSTTFNAAMAEHTRDVAPDLIEAYDFGRFRIIADLGGGDGTLLAAVLRAVPGPRGILFDLPAGLANAEWTLTEAGVADRCEIVPGDFFDSVPEGADAYLLKSVIHDWDDEKSAAILRTCRAAMRPDARVLILEGVVPPLITPHGDSFFVLNDVNMLLCTGGRERTKQEYRDLLTAAGLRLTSMTDPVPPFDYRIIEAAPAQ